VHGPLNRSISPGEFTASRAAGQLSSADKASAAGRGTCPASRGMGLFHAGRFLGHGRGVEGRDTLRLAMAEGVKDQTGSGAPGTVWASLAQPRRPPPR
jgi:hypothetical protein